MKAKYGAAFAFEFESPQADFLILGSHPRKSVADLIAEFGFEPRHAYLARATRVRARALARAGRRGG